MYKSTLAGHALHPQLVLFPGGLLPFSFAMDVMHAATGDRRYADAAYLTMVGGVAGGLAAGAAGAVDYYSIPERTAVKRTANLHASMNIGIMALYGVNLLARRGGRNGWLPTLLSGIGAGGLIVSAWYGAKMSYDQGMRVKGVDPVAHAKDLTIPGDDKIHEAFERLEDAIAPESLALPSAR